MSLFDHNTIVRYDLGQSGVEIKVPVTVSILYAECGERASYWSPGTADYIEAEIRTRHGFEITREAIGPDQFDYLVGNALSSWAMQREYAA